MIRRIIYGLLLLPLSTMAQLKPVGAGVYPWPPAVQKTTVFFSGSADVLSFLEVSANQLLPGKKKKVKVPSDEEQLLLVRSGTLKVTLNNETSSLGKGSIVFIMPSDKYVLQNEGPENVTYHQMRYRSKAPGDVERGKSAGGSFVKDWNALPFNEHERGGVRPYFQQPTALTKRFEMHVTTLKEGLNSHAPHTHGAEEIILVLEGNVEMLIGEQSYKAGPGDVLFVPTMLPHGLKNDGNTPCSYFAYQWE